MGGNSDETKGVEMTFQNNGDEEYGQKTQNAEVFGPSVTVWEQLRKTNRTHIILAAVIALVIGIILGAGVTAIIFTQTGGDAGQDKNDTAKGANAPCPITTASVVITPEATTEARTTTERTPEAPLTTTATQTKTEQTLEAPLNCSLSLQGKCFQVVVNEDLTVHLNQARLMCEKIGWNLANIYSTEHYYMMEGYLRTKFPFSGYVSAWTGMTMIPKDKQLVESTGKNVTLERIRWHIGYPTTDQSATHIGLDVYKYPKRNNIRKQGLWNFDPSWNGNAAICEKQL